MLKTLAIAKIFWKDNLPMSDYWSQEVCDIESNSSWTLSLKLTLNHIPFSGNNRKLYAG